MQPIKPTNDVEVRQLVEKLKNLPPKVDTSEKKDEFGNQVGPNGKSIWPEKINPNNLKNKGNDIALDQNEKSIWPDLSISKDKSDKLKKTLGISDAE